MTSKMERKVKSQLCLPGSRKHYSSPNQRTRHLQSLSGESQTVFILIMSSSETKFQLRSGLVIFRGPQFMEEVTVERVLERELIWF